MRRMPIATRFAPAVFALSAVLALAAATPVGAVSNTTDWSAYLDGPTHNSYAAGQTAITPATTVTSKWHFADSFLTSPVVADGAVFAGSFQGNLYKINA